jgi:diguanylate cyclase (GGDEF)-like protein
MGDITLMEYMKKINKHKALIIAYFVVEIVLYLLVILGNQWMIYITLSLATMFLFVYHIRKRDSYKKMHQENYKFQTILDAQDNMIIISNGKEIVDANEKVLEFFGFSSYKSMKKQSMCISEFFIEHENFFHLGRIEDDQNWVEVIPTLPEKQRVVNMIGYNMTAYAFKVKINRYGDSEHSIISFNDITNILAEQEILKYKAQHDNLTGIYNRQKIDDVFVQLCKFSARRKEQVSVILIDIDHFKIINDTYGHIMGDNVLKILVNHVKENIREGDIFGRWGGEEFILIMRHSTLDDAYHKAERLRESIEQLDIVNLPKITASFGVASLDSHDTPDSLFRKVDLALYEAKNEGRNRVVSTKSMLELV